MGEGNIFSLSTLAGRGVPRPRSVRGGGYPIQGLGEGVPHPRSGWEGYPVWVGGYPNPRCGWGTPPPIRHSSIANTCYAAGGMPLVFTQEDFLVYLFICLFLFQLDDQ